MDLTVEHIGWISGILFAFCGLPQAIQSIRTGNSEGVSLALLLMWGTGEVLAIIYVLGKHGLDKPLIFNYALNLVFISIILKYKVRQRKIVN